MGAIQTKWNQYGSEEVKRLAEWMKGKGWVTTTIIAENTKISPQTQRKICNDFPTLLASGTEGYKLMTDCSPEERDHCIAHLRSRARCITERADAIEAEYPRLQRGMF